MEMWLDSKITQSKSHYCPYETIVFSGQRSASSDSINKLCKQEVAMWLHLHFRLSTKVNIDWKIYTPLGKVSLWDSIINVPEQTWIPICQSCSLAVSAWTVSALPGRRNQSPACFISGTNRTSLAPSLKYASNVLWINLNCNTVLEYALKYALMSYECSI